MSYINTDKILKYLDRMSSNDGDSSVHCTVYEIKEWIAHNIEEDVKPVPMGIWVRLSPTGYKCSECWTSSETLNLTQRCPHCGAKMEGK